jgi:prephenate dehydrogenase
VVDTASVKSALRDVWDSVADRPPVLSINPMFAPALTTAGRPCLVVDPDGSPSGRGFADLLSGWGMRIVRVHDVEEHDRLCAAVQSAVHAAVLGFGSFLATADLPVDEVLSVAPPPCRAILLMLARIVSGAPEVYEDIQIRNKFAEQARASLRDGLMALEHEVQVTAELRATRGAVRAWFGNALGPLAEECAGIFAHLMPPEPNAPAAVP